VGGIYIGWGVALLGIGIGSLRLASVRSRRILRGSAAAYQLTVWIIHLVGDRSTYARSLWVRDLVLTILFLGVVFVLTALLTSRATAPRRVNREL